MSDKQAVLNNPTRKERSGAVDAAKAIALLFVVAGHAVTSETMLFRFIFGFHMPFFFIASGLFFRMPNISFAQFAKKKAKALLIPYAVFALLGLLIMWVFKSWRVPGDALWYGIRYLYIAQPAALGSVWFLVCLFVSLLMVFVLFRLDLCDKWIPLILTILALAAVGTVFVPWISVAHFGRLPWKIDAGVTAASFLLIGYAFTKSGLAAKIRLWQRIAGLFILPVIVFVFAVKLNGYVNICDCVYGNPVYYYIAALAGSLWVFDIGSFLAKSKLLCWVGRNSLYIFSIHSFVLWAWIRVYCKIMHVETEYLTNNVWVAVISVITLASTALAVKGYEVVKTQVVKRVRKTA